MKTYRYINYAVNPVHSVNMFTVIIYFSGSKGKITSDPFYTEDEATAYLVDEINRHWEATKSDLALTVINSRGHEIYDTKQFTIEKLNNGKFSYINHDEEIALSWWGSIEAAKHNYNLHRYSKEIHEKAKQRYLDYSSNTKQL